MATNLTFTSLVSDLTRYLERGQSFITDPTVFDQIPRLINQAERRCADMLKLLGQIEVFNSTPPQGLQAGVAVLAKPDRWRKSVSFFFGAGATQNSRTPLFSRGYEFCMAYWPDRTLTAPPEFYADYDLNHWLIAPTPDVSYPFESLNYMLPVLLDSGNQTNFWTAYTPALLLYSALLEAESFLKDDPRIAVWKQYQQDEVQSLGGQDLQRIMDRASVRNTP